MQKLKRNLKFFICIIVLIAVSRTDLVYANTDIKAGTDLPAVYEPAIATGIVTNCHFLNLRSGPGISYPAFAYLAGGDIVTIIAYERSWIKVDSHRGMGWVFENYLYILDPLDENVIAISHASTFAAGLAASFAIDESGTLWGWGSSHVLPIEGITANQPRPVRIMDDVIAVSANEQGRHAAAITADGGLWVWGNNNAGQIGDGTITTFTEFDEDWLRDLMEDNIRRSPVRVLDDVAAVSAGTWHTMAIKNDGSLWAWGLHEFLPAGGDGTSTIPVHIMDDVIAVSAGLFHTLALTSDGSVWAWGTNFTGLIAEYTGDLHQRLGPIKIMDDVVYISASTFHSMIITSDGRLWGWGENSWGQLGDGTWQHRFSPVHIMDNVAAVSNSAYHTMAITSDGQLWGWGGNLWDGFLHDTEYQMGPVHIMDNVAAVSMGYTHNLAVKTDGSLWAWGINNSGQIGDGTISVFVNIGAGRYILDPDNTRLSPVQVMDNVMLP